MPNVSFRLFLSFWWLVSCALFPFQLVRAQSPSPSVSPGSVATPTTVSPGVVRWTVTDPDFMAHVNGRTTLPDPTASANGDVTVRTPGTVSTRNGNVPVSVSRKIKYSDLIKPWKSAGRLIPFVGTGLAIWDILGDLCIRYDSDKWQECTYQLEPAPSNVVYRIDMGSPHYFPVSYYSYSEAVAQINERFPLANSGIEIVSITAHTTTHYHPQIGNYEFTSIRVDRSSFSDIYYRPYYTCPGIEGYMEYPFPCEANVANGWRDLGPDYDPGPALDGYPGSPKYNPARPPLLFDQLPSLQDEPGVSDSGPRIHPSDEGSPNVTGPTAPVTGPSTTQTTNSGITVTNNTSNVTYSGDTTTVVNNTTVTYINNEGDIINEETTSDNEPTECEKNPNSVSCQDLGSPPNGEIPKSDQPWSITPESLPGGSCPPPLSATFAGKTHSISFTPLCNALPDVRMVVLLLSGVMAAWIVAGGLKS